MQIKFVLCEIGTTSITLQATKLSDDSSAVALAIVVVDTPTTLLAARERVATVRRRHAPRESGNGLLHADISVAVHVKRNGSRP